jgi:hypothetical protein
MPRTRLCLHAARHPWFDHALFLLGRGAGNCRVGVKIYGAFQRPVRLFLSATSASLRWRDLWERLRAPPWGGRHARTQAYGAAAMTAGRRRLPPVPREPGLCKPPDATRHCPATLCASQARPALCGDTGRGGRSDAVSPAPVAGGRPFSADPGREVLRPSSTPGADPASPQRLAVYPMTEREDDGTGLEECGDFFRTSFFFWRRRSLWLSVVIVDLSNVLPEPPLSSSPSP